MKIWKSVVYRVSASIMHQKLHSFVNNFNIITSIHHPYPVLYHFGGGKKPIQHDYLNHVKHQCFPNPLLNKIQTPSTKKIKFTKNFDL